MLKEDFKSNTYFNKLLINRIEYRQFLQKQGTFRSNNFLYKRNKKYIKHQIVNEAIKYLDNIQPLELSAKIAFETTYFFKKFIREEFENAKEHNDELI